MGVDLEIRDHVAWITMNRPERLNALDAEGYAALSAAWVRVRDDREIRVAVITGAGERSFTTGADLTGFVGRQSIGDFARTQYEMLLNRGLEVWKPVIAAVNGYCLGGGMTLLLATDLRLAVPEARFAVPEVTRGLIPGNGGTQRILEQLPYPVAMEMLLTGRWMEAAEAARYHLINQVVPRDELLVEAERRAAALAKLPPMAVQAAKELATRSRGMARSDGLRLEAALLKVLEQTADFREAGAAFREKRDGVYQGE